MKRGAFPITAIVLVLMGAHDRAVNAGQTLAIRAGKILTVTDGTIENGVIIVRDGKIDAVGANLDVPVDTPIVVATDRVVVPGFIDAHSHLGLSLDALGEIDETVQPVTADMRIIDAFDSTADELKRAVRFGVTATMLAPGSRNPIGGQTAVVKLAGDDQERWLVREPAGVEVSFTNDALMSDRRPTSRPGLIALVQEHLDAAADHDPGKFDPSIEILSRLRERRLPAYVYARTVDEISPAVNVIERYNLRAVIVGARQADEIAAMLADREIPVIYDPLPLYSKDHDLKRVGRLAQAGVKIAFASFAPKTSPGDIRTSAVLAVRYGLDRDEALRALTINAAELLGVAGRLGSIRNGRDADLVVFDGDPLEPSSRVEMVFIDGKLVYQRKQK